MVFQLCDGSGHLPDITDLLGKEFVCYGYKKVCKNPSELPLISSYQYIYSLITVQLIKGAHQSLRSLRGFYKCMDEIREMFQERYP